MNELNKILDSIRETKESTFSIRNDWAQLINNIQEICFLGEIDRDIFYMTMMHQIIDCEGNVKSLTIDEMNHFYLTGALREGFKPYIWTFWRLHLESKYLSVFMSYKGTRKHSPKDNFGNNFEQVKEFKGQDVGIYEIPYSELTGINKEVIDDLVETVIYSKTNRIEIADWNKKVFVGTAQYFGEINNNDFIQTEHLESAIPEKIMLPQKYTPVNIRNQTELLEVVRGISYNEVNFDKAPFNEKFTNNRDLHNYFYSLIDHINKNNDLLGLQQSIKVVRKHWQSNQWPITPQGEDPEKFKNKYTKYEIFVTKFEDKVAIKAEVWEYGISFYLTNYIPGPNPWS